MQRASMSERLCVFATSSLIDALSGFQISDCIFDHSNHVAQLGLLLYQYLMCCCLGHPLLQVSVNIKYDSPTFIEISISRVATIFWAKPLYGPLLP